MNHHFLAAVAAGPLTTPANLARAALAGDASALFPLSDALDEEGFLRMNLKEGDRYFIQTVAHYFLGRVVSSTLSEIVLREASCVYATGAWEVALRTGQFEHAEDFPPDLQIRVNLGAVVCVLGPWPH